MAPRIINLRLSVLTFARREHGVDGDLGAVEEVAELRLPDAQPVRRLYADAVLEGQHRLLGQRAVDHLMTH